MQGRCFYNSNLCGQGVCGSKGLLLHTQITQLHGNGAGVHAWTREACNNTRRADVEVCHWEPEENGDGIKDVWLSSFLLFFTTWFLLTCCSPFPSPSIAFQSFLTFYSFCCSLPVPPCLLSLSLPIIFPSLFLSLRSSQFPCLIRPAFLQLPTSPSLPPLSL